MRVSVIIPCYNEEDTIAETIERVKKVDFGCRKEILVVDDGSTDNSANIVNQIGGVRVIGHNRNCGKGAAVQTG